MFFPARISASRTESLRRILLILAVLLLLLLFLAVPGVSWGQDLTDADHAAAELAQKITAAAGPGSRATLEVRNASSADAATFAGLQAKLEAALRHLGLGLSQENSGTVIGVTLSENVRGLLWVAEVRTAKDAQTFMAEFTRPQDALALGEVKSMLIKRVLLWEQAEQILDAAVLDYPSGVTPTMLVLSASNVAVYKFRDGKWGLRDSQPIPRPDPYPRDLRSRLVVQGGSMRGFFGFALPGWICTSDVGQSMRLVCNEQDRDSAVVLLNDLEEGNTAAQVVEGRNYFEFWAVGQGLGPQEKTQILSGASWRDHGIAYLLLTHPDGRATLYEDSSSAPAVFTGWGSDVAAVESECGSKAQVFTTGSRDWTQPDTIRAVEVSGGRAVQVAAPVEFAGPVTALWTTAVEGSAIAVVRNLKTGRYEAYHLSIACAP